VVDVAAPTISHEAAFDGRAPSSSGGAPLPGELLEGARLPVDRDPGAAGAAPPPVTSHTAPAEGDDAWFTPRGRRSPSLGRRFQRLLLTTALAGSGDGLAYAALPLLAAAIDPRPIAVSAVAAAQQAPFLLALLPAGVIADRLERAKMMLVANLARACVLGALAAFVATGHLELIELIAFAFGIGSAQVFYHAAGQAVLPELVRRKALPRANGNLVAADSATEHLAGPAVGSLAFSFLRSLPFGADAVAVALSALPLFGLRSAKAPSGGVKGSALDGLRYIVATPALRTTAGLITALALGQGLSEGILVLVATRDWHIPVAGYGAFIASAAVGNLLGALLSRRITARIGTARTLIVAAILSGAGYVVMSRSGAWLEAAIAFFVVGIAVATGAVAGTSLRQQVTPQALQGRVGAPWRGLVWSAVPIGALLGGVIATHTTLRTPLQVAGIAQMILGLLVAGPLLRALRSHDAGSEDSPDDDPGTRPERSSPHPRRDGPARVADITEIADPARLEPVGGTSSTVLTRPPEMGPYPPATELG
jgi:MFS family permease